MAGAYVPSLYKYQQQVQRMLRDQQQTWINPEDLTEYVNRARREVAMRTQAIRIVTEIGGEIERIEVEREGEHYRHPRVWVSWPDAPSGEQPHPGGRRARAVASHIDGRITSISVEDGGSGYFHPHVWIWDADEEEDEERDHWDERRIEDWEEDHRHGHGARAHARTVPLLHTEGHQEIYRFSDVPLQRHAGVAEIFAVKGISFIYANYRYSIPVFNFSTYQAYVRIYPQQYLYIPTAAAQYGQGVSGSIYMYPIPSAEYQQEWDCFCLPQDMEDDQDFEAIPKPWCDAVPYFATHLAYLELQNHNAAQYYLSLYDDMVRRYSAYARPGRAINPYGRWAAFV